MRVIFLLDNNEYVEVGAPEKLQLRQVGPYQAALGVEVRVPVNNEDGTPKVTDGVPETQEGFRSFINYAVNLALPEASEQKSVPVIEAVPVSKKKAKAKSNKNAN